MSKQRQITLADAYYASEGADPGNKRNLTVTCPNCGKKKLAINFAKNLFNCASCTSKAGKGSYGGADPAVLYGFLTHEIKPLEIKSNKSLRDKMRRELNEKLGNSNFVPVQIDYSEDSDKASPEILDIAYRALHKELVLYDHHYNDLVKRGLSHMLIERLGFKSVPTQEERIRISKKLRESGIQLKGVPGFFYGKFGWELKSNSAGYFIFIRNIFGQIVGAQIANDDRNSDAKYYQFSSSGLEQGTSSGTSIHFIGSLKGEDTIYLTEGPLKANIAYRFMNKPFMAILGINALSSLELVLGDLKKRGIKNIVMAIDMDYKTNVHVKKGRNDIIRMLRKYKFNVNDNFGWESHNGIDDYLLSLAMKKDLYKPKFRIPWEKSEVHPTPKQSPYL